MENNNSGAGMGRGWPLGLGSINLRVRLVEAFPIATGGAAVPRSLFVNVPSSTFSSFSSSNLDTESTMSFFQDNSKSLGRLIGLRPRNNRRSRSELYGNSIVPLDGPQRITSYQEHQSQFSDDHGMDDLEMCGGFCVPLCLLPKTNNPSSRS